MSTLDVLLSRLEKIHQNLGGDRIDIGSRERKDKFAVIRLKCEEQLHTIESCQDQRDKISSFKNNEDPEIIQLKYKILLLIKETDKGILELNKILEKQKSKPKKYAEVDIEAKTNKLSWLERKLEDAKRGEDLGIVVSRKADDLGKLKAELINFEDITLENIGRKGDMLDIEKEAKQRWEDYDQRIDDLAGKIGENVEELRMRALNFNNALDRHEEKLDSLDNVVDQANQELETSTKKLKKLLIKVRAGDKFCVTLCLLIILIGLLTVGYNMIK
ncbi:unnamed protein product [Blepharisma stoltei]|uniref:t-SNARE coiled-coil homology domain-containing protein n=1 Tax=Blepharisma stoltei TaxID=1481888 RepID=A0AAU9IJ61_9CILI|nr:unnamed protein product [Blepharisma stoltei]